MEFAISELKTSRDLLLMLAPATENEEYVLWKVRALEAAICELEKPRFEVSPLV